MKSKCKKCGEKIHYTEILKCTYLNSTGKMCCEKCNTENEITLHSRFLFGGLLCLGLIVSMFNLKNPTTSFVSIVYTILVISLSPFFIKFEGRV